MNYPVSKPKPRFPQGCLMIVGGLVLILVVGYAIVWLAGRILTPAKAVAQLRRGAPDTVVYVPVYATWAFFPHPMLGLLGYDSYYGYDYYDGPIGVGSTVVYSTTNSSWIDNSAQVAQSSGSNTGTTADTVEADVDPSDPSGGSDAVST